MDAKHLIDLINEVIKEYELDRGNGGLNDIDVGTLECSIVVEAPNHSIVRVNLDSVIWYLSIHQSDEDIDKIILGNIKLAIAKRIRLFSVNDELDYFYESSITNPHCRFTRSECWNLCMDDKAYFKDLEHRLRMETIGIPEIKEDW